MIRIGKFSPWPGKVFYFAISEDGVVGATYAGEVGFVKALGEGKHLNDVLRDAKVQTLEFFVDFETAVPVGYLLLVGRESIVAVWRMDQGVYRTYPNANDAVDDFESWPERPVAPRP